MKRSANLSVDAALLEEARALDINLSQTLDGAPRQAVADAKATAWRAENAEALASSNAWVEKHGLPLAKSRQF